MSKKSSMLIPVGIAIGAAVLITSGGKNKYKSSSSGKGGNSPAEPTKPTLPTDVVLAGEVAGWGWEVREVSKTGVAKRYFGYVREIGKSAKWTWLGVVGANTAKNAKNLALEYIANKTAAQPQGDPEFNWDDAHAQAQSELEKTRPGTLLWADSDGSIVVNGVQCYWSIVSTAPPSPQGEYAGFLICPATNEKSSVFGDSVEEIRNKIGV